jgi:hypothetical protein
MMPMSLLNMYLKIPDTATMGIIQAITLIPLKKREPLKSLLKNMAMAKPMGNWKIRHQRVNHSVFQMAVHMTLS